MRLIDADALYERLKADEELARDRVIDTPNSFPNGMLNPAAVRYQAQLTERTRLKEIVYDAPTIEERKVGMWEKIRETYCSWSCSVCKEIVVAMPEQMGYPLYDYCPNCGAKMDGNT